MTNDKSTPSGTVVADDYFSILLDGTFHALIDEEPPVEHDYDSDLPLHYDGDGRGDV